MDFHERNKKFTKNQNNNFIPENDFGENVLDETKRASLLNYRF